jgi:adenosylhomocysteine nucleosidase
VIGDATTGRTAIAIIGALPREVAGLVRGVRPEPRQRGSGVYVYVLPGTVVVCAGMGAERATLAVRAALDTGAVSMLVSAGLAGGCDPAFVAGAVVEASVVVDALSGARFQLSRPSAAEAGSTLVTTHTIAGVHEKARLFASYGAAVVDMEAATVARLAELHGIPFRAIKAVSDAHDFELTSLSRFATKTGHFRTGAFALHTALRPHRWHNTIQLGAGSQRALLALNKRLKEICL